MGIMRGITIGSHYPVASLLHRLDPRTKILSSLFFMVALLWAANPVQIALIALFSAVAVALSRLPLPLLFGGLMPLRYIVILTVLLHSLMTTGGSIVFSWWRITVWQTGVATGFLMSLRLVLMVLTTSLLTLTTSPIVLTDGLERLMGIFQPLGFPAHEVALMITMALRFVPTLLDEGDKLAKAQMARGVNFDRGNLFVRLRAMIPLLVPLFIGAFRRADDLALAMQARCYNGGVGRGHFRELHFGAGDIAVVVISALFLIAVILVGGK